MARRREDKAANVERGQRLLLIREALRKSQYDMAEVLNEAARAIGLPATYRYYTVSRNEAGTVSFEDAAVWLSVDPEARSWNWLVFGREQLSTDVDLPAPVLKTFLPEKAQRPKKRRAGGDR